MRRERRRHRQLNWANSLTEEHIFRRDDSAIWWSQNHGVVDEPVCVSDSSCIEVSDDDSVVEVFDLTGNDDRSSPVGGVIESPASHCSSWPTNCDGPCCNPGIPEIAVPACYRLECDFSLE